MPNCKIAVSKKGNITKQLCVEFWIATPPQASCKALGRADADRKSAGKTEKRLEKKIKLTSKKIKSILNQKTLVKFLDRLE